LSSGKKKKKKKKKKFKKKKKKKKKRKNSKKKKKKVGGLFSKNFVSNQILLTNPSSSSISITQNYHIRTHLFIYLFILNKGISIFYWKKM